LGLHGVLAGAIEGFDSEVLLDPFEEQFHLPAGLVDQSNGECRERKVVGREFESLSGFHIEITDAPQRVRIHLRGTDGRQYDGVIGSNASGLVDRV